MNEKISLLDVPPSEWPDLLKNLGEDGFRAAQIAEWIFKKRVFHFEKMLNLPSSLRKKLSDAYHLQTLLLDNVLTSKEDGTTRYFFKTLDNEVVSCVYLPFKERQSLCLSSQVGCAWGCVFCASGLVKLKRNLNVSEILGQIMIVEEAARKPLDSLLFMGMGEPLANYSNLVRSLAIIRSSQGLNFGGRHVTVSTCGLVPQIETLADDAPKINLAISLHAAFDELRKKLLPKASHWTIRELLKATRTFSMKSESRVTFEYILIKNVNDSEHDAKRLANLVRGLAKHGDYWVNLIAYNPVPGLPYEKPDESQLLMFQEILTARRVPVRLRKPQGVDIGAGCGQLGEAQ